MRTALTLFILFLSFVPSFAQNDELLTVAEESNYTLTATNEEVLDFCRRLAAATPRVHLTFIGESTEGHPIPLLIIGNPAPHSPAEMIHDPRLPVYIQANIHPGEIEGKEASLMLARDLAVGKHQALLEHLVVLVVPNYNVEGNARMASGNRYHQPGPDVVGERANSMNLDLNRDWVKLESPEARAVVSRILTPWDPVLVVDCHTTNGSLHTEPMTWAPQMHPSGDTAVKDYATEVLLPAAAKTLEEEFGHESIPYGNFMDRQDPTKGWATFESQPRYTTNYIGLRNRLSVLLETYVYAEYPVRIESTYGMLLGMLRNVSGNRETVARLIHEADTKANDRAVELDPQKDTFAVEVDLQPYDKPITIHTWEGRELYTDERGRRRVRPSGEQIDVTVQYYGNFVPKRSIPLPAWYALPASEKLAVDKLLQHGITVECLERELTIKVMRFIPSELTSAERPFQGHIFTTLKGEWQEEEATLPVNTYLVTTAQPLGMLAAYLLEPESDDGLTTWNFFDARLARQWGRGALPHPVMKIMTPGSLPTRIIE
jgi:hypothetical protein